MKTSPFFLKPLLLIISVILAVPSTGWSATHKKKRQTLEDLIPDERNVSVEVPQSRLKAVAPDVDTTFHLDRLEFQTSMWKPNSLTLSSQIPNAGEFQPGSVPMFRLTMMMPIWKGGAGRLSIRTGAGVYTMKRFAQFTLGADTTVGEQSLILVPFVIGLHGQPSFLSWKGISTQFAAVLSPTVALSSDSPLNRSQSTTGMQYIGSAGLAIGLPWAWSAITGNLNGQLESGPELTADWMESFGSIQSGSLRGSGFELGARFFL